VQQLPWKIFLVTLAKIRHHNELHLDLKFFHTTEPSIHYSSALFCNLHVFRNEDHVNERLNSMCAREIQMFPNTKGVGHENQNKD
jgi:hypothetical protein